MAVKNGERKREEFNGRTNQYVAVHILKADGEQELDLGREKLPLVAHRDQLVQTSASDDHRRSSMNL